MTQITDKPTPSRPSVPPPLLPLLKPENRARVGTGLLAGAGGFAVMVLVLLLRSGLANFPVTVWGLALVLVLTATGAWAHFAEPRTPEEGANQMRLLALAVGGGIGFATAMLGLAMPIIMYPAVFGGGLEVWRQNWGKVMLCALALFGGLALMFFSLQLGRTVERANASIRRLLYGFNAVLTGLLLLAVLGLVNVLAHVRLGPLNFFSSQWDWTASGVYSLSTLTENTLKSLDKPVKVYVIIRQYDRNLIAKETTTLLDNCRSVTKKLEWEPLSPDLDRKTVFALASKYQLDEVQGLLVVYGSEPDQSHDFIPYDKLFSDVSPPAERGREAQPRLIFKGEAALRKALVSLAEGKKKAFVYFTQGSGEPTLFRSRGRGQASVNELRDRLTRANYDVKELKFTPGVETVPADADVVVVVGPRLTLPPRAVKALEKYMNPTGTQPKGKMIVLADVVPTGDRSGMVPLGLEPMLGRFGVRLTRERILADKPHPAELRVLPNLTEGHPIPTSFRVGNRIILFSFDDVRALDVTPPPPGRRNPYKVETILYTLPGMDVWKESSMRDPDALVEALRSQGELQKKFSDNPLPVAVTVSESLSALPNDPQHAGLRGREDKPRLVVFGNASWATDEAIASPAGRFNGDLFSSCLAWLRQRPNIGAEDTEGKERKAFTLAAVATPEMVSRLRWTPIALILLAVVGLGGTVWLVRRR